MIKNLILILLIVSIATKTTNIEFDVNQPFDKNNHVFTFNNEAKKIAYYLVKINSRTILQYEYECTGLGKQSGTTTGQPNFIIKLQKGECSINIYSSSWVFKLKGTIFIHPLDREINVDFEAGKYELARLVNFDEEFPPIVFSVSNLNKDTEVHFSYSKNTMISKNDKKFYLKNPYEICFENICKKNIEDYKFLKNKNYKIYVKPEELKTDTYSEYYLNTFSFYKKSGSSDDSNSSNDSNNSYEINNSNESNESNNSNDSDGANSFGNIILMKPLNYLIFFLLL